jgi:membrane-associated phospholipid phosphatase
MTTPDSSVIARPRAIHSADPPLRLLKCTAALLLLTVPVLLLDLGSNPDMAYILAGATAIQIGSRPRPRQLIYAGAVALIVGACYLAAAGHLYTSWAAWLSASAAALGVGSLAVLCVASFATEDDAAARHALKSVSIIPVFALAGSLFMQIAQNIPPRTFDLYLYKFDAQLGVQAGFWCGRLFLRSPLLKELESVVYNALGIFPAVVFSAGLKINRRLPFNPLTTFVWAGIASFCLYQICPGTAPSAVFHGAYPGNPPAAGLLPLARIEVPGSWRNAMPSMHTTWALLAWTCSLRLQRWIRIFSTAFVALTCLAALGLGQHYLVDLIVACAFTVAASAACCGDLPFSAPARWQALAVAGAVTLGWLVMLRLGWLLSLPQPVAWLAVGATVIGSGVLQTRLIRAHHAIAA